MSNFRDPNRAGHVVLEFPLTPAIARRRYAREMERVARLDYETGKLHRVNRRVCSDYNRLVRKIRFPD
jgi:hypothetical protein